MRKLYFIGLLFLCCILLASCGGVQRNPASPPWNQGQEQPPGTETPKPGEEPGKSTAAGGAGTILEGDYETLIPQAEGSLEKGDLQTAFNAYHSALQLKPGDAQAGFGKVICQIAKDWRTFAIFRGAGADKLYYNTPLLMHPELIPNPIMADDSYLLRLFTIGKRYEETFTLSLPTWGVKPVPKTDTAKPPVSSMEGEGTVIETEGTTPEGAPPVGEAEKKPAPEEGAEKEEPPKEEKEPPKEEGGEEEKEQPPSEEAPPDEKQPPEEENPPEEETSLPAGWVPLTNRNGQQGGGPDAGGPEDWAEWEKKYKESGGELPPDAGSMVTPPATGPGQLPEGTTPIDSEYFKTEVPLTITALDDEAASLRIEQFNTHTQNMKSNIDSLITLLESMSDEINEDFIFQVGLVLRAKTEKYVIVFRKQDYDLLLAELRILSGIISYVTTYDSTWTFVNYIYPVEDFNTDGIYSPEEYYAFVPFGTIKENGETLLEDARDALILGIENAADAWDLVLGRAFQEPNESTNEMLALPVGGLSAAVLDDQKEIYDDFAAKFYDTIDIALRGRGSDIEVKVAPAVLFDATLGDVRALLPCIDTMGALVPCDEASSGEWPQPTFGGLFPDGLADDSTAFRMGKVRGIAVDNNYSLYEGGSISYAGGMSEIAENGEFLLSGVELNELIGLPITLTPKDGEPWEGVIHSMVENVYTMPPLPMPTGGPLGEDILRIPGLGGFGRPGEGGTSTETPSGDGNGGSGLTLG